MVTTTAWHLPEHSVLPYELVYQAIGATPGHVRVVPGRPAALAADWRRCGRVEVMAAGRPLVVERDHDGASVRVVEPMSGIPLAGFRPDGRAGLRRGARQGGRVGGWRPGKVLLSDGTVLRWVCPTRSVFECGFLRGPANVVLFANDGTAFICVSRGLERTGPRDAAPDVPALLVLGWFLLLDAGLPLDAGTGEVAGVPAYADLPEDPAGHRAPVHVHAVPDVLAS